VVTNYVMYKPCIISSFIVHSALTRTAAARASLRLVSTTVLGGVYYIDESSGFID